MSSLQDRLLLAEEDFLTSLTDGTDDAICAFEKRWESLVHDIDVAFDTNGLDDEISTLAHVVATRMSHVAETATDLFSNYNTLTMQLVDQLDGLMSELSLEDATSNHPVPHALHPASCPPCRPNDCGSLPCHGKRRRMDEENDCQPSCSRQRPKRQRLWSAPPTSSIYPGTPQPSKEDALVSIPDVTTFASAASHGSSSRKRRLSETDAIASRCKRFHAGPRLHAVSDSFHVIQQAPQLSTVSDNLPETSSAIFSNSISLDGHPLMASCEDFTGDVFDIGPLIELSYPQFAIESSPLPEHRCFDQFLSSRFLSDHKETAPQVASSLHHRHWSLGDSSLTFSPMPSSPSLINSPLSARSLSLPPTTPIAISLDSPLPHYEVGCIDPGPSDGAYGLDWASIGSAPTNPCFGSPQALPDDHSPPPPFAEESQYTVDWCSLPCLLDPLSWLSIPPPPYQLPIDLRGLSKFEPEVLVGALQTCP